jgi:hypothetical protein
VAARASLDHTRVDPGLARETWRLAEPLHGMIYFTPEGPEQYERIGLRGRRMGYFASRAAAFGPVGAKVVIGTFYNFNPELITATIPAAWDLASPATVLTARYAAVDAALRSALGPAIDSEEMVEAAELAGRAARTACDHVEGRPLFAAHAGLDWPDAPHLALWHAQTLLREFRGDGHIAALTVEGFSGIEALIGHSAMGEIPAEALRVSRGWDEQAWAAGVDGLRERGVLVDGDEPTFSADGKAQRQWIEDRTDTLALPAYSVLGPEGCARLGELVRPFSRAIVATGVLPVRPSRAAI